ncbi:hypothetical protein H632_c4186p0, partial [Helicosporidium sp. ATCC 50920]
MGRVGPTDGALGAQIRATFEANPNEEWLSAARSLYAMLRDGNCTQALPVDTFGYSSVGQDTSASVTQFIPGQVVYGANFNLVLLDRTFEWLTHQRAEAMNAPFSGGPDVAAVNSWKHVYAPYLDSIPSVASIIQITSYNQDHLRSTLQNIVANPSTFWPEHIWGKVEVLPDAEIYALGGIYAPPPPTLPSPPPS